MKNTILMAAALLATTSAHASTLLCSTHPSATGSQYVVSIDADGSSETGDAEITLHGGRAHFIMIVGKYPVQIGHLGPEVGLYTNTEKDFELTVGFQPFGGQHTMAGTLKMKALNDVTINEPVTCHE